MNKNLFKLEFEFEGDPAILSICSKDVGNYFSSEFVERREILVNYLNPCYDKWYEEFNRKFPGINGDSKEYLDFIKHKQEKYILKANRADIWLNKVKLYIDEDCDICGFVEQLDIKIHLTLVPYKGSE